MMWSPSMTGAQPNLYSSATCAHAAICAVCEYAPVLELDQQLSDLLVRDALAVVQGEAKLFVLSANPDRCHAGDYATLPQVGYPMRTAMPIVACSQKRGTTPNRILSACRPARQHPLPRIALGACAVTTTVVFA